VFTPGRAALLLVIVTAVLYAPTINYGWVYEDTHDFQTLTRPIGESWSVWAWKPARSLTEITFALTYQAFGLWPGAYHVGNLALHLLNGGVLYGLASACLGPWAALVALGVFLLHPVQVESVAYVSNRADLLATLALLLGLWAVTAERWLLVGLACIAAFLAKETAIVALPICAVFACWRGTRVAPLVLILLLPIAVFGGVFLLLTYPLDLDLRNALTQLAAMTRLLALVIVPMGLTIDHDWNFITPMVMSLTAGLWTVALLIVWGWRSSWLALAIVSCLIVVAPRMAVSLVEGLHEHHLYGCMVFISLCLGALIGAESDRHGISASLA
jgi:protein O-mannosyl-transferase